MKIYIFAAIVLLGVGAEASAQGTPDAVYARAQTLVSEGQGAQGRALVDSMYRISAPGSRERAEALFWRATHAATAADAERDYRAIVVDQLFPTGGIRVPLPLGVLLSRFSRTLGS